MSCELIPVELPHRLQCLCVPVRWRVEDVSLWPTTRRKGTVPWFYPERKEPLEPSDEEMAQWTDEEIVRWQDAVFAEMEKPRKTPEADTFDPYEMRLKYFRLTPGDNAAAAEFLSMVGLYNKPNLAWQLAVVANQPGSKRAMLSEIFRLLRRKEHVRGIDGEHDVSPEDARAFPARMFWEFREGMLSEMKTGASRTLAEWEYQARLAVPFRLGPTTVLTTYAWEDAVVASIRLDQLRKAKFQKCLCCGVSFAAVGARKRKYCEERCTHIMALRQLRARQRKNRKLKS